METITFAKLVENALPGAELVRTDFTGKEVTGIWTGKTYDSGTGNKLAFVYNCATNQLSGIGFDSPTDWSVRMDSTGTPVMLDGTGAFLVEAAGNERINYVRANRRNEQLESEFKRFRANASEVLAEWANSNIEGDSNLNEFSDLLEEIGLEGLKREYAVTVRVTYQVEFTVEATSASKAEEDAEENLSDYVNDNIDVSYWEDYSIESVDEA